VGIRCTSVKGIFEDAAWLAASAYAAKADAVQMLSSTAAILRALPRMTDSSHHDHVSDGSAEVFQRPLLRQQGIITRYHFLPQDETAVSSDDRDDFGGDFTCFGRPPYWPVRRFSFSAHALRHKSPHLLCRRPTTSHMQFASIRWKRRRSTAISRIPFGRRRRRSRISGKSSRTRANPR